MIPRSNVRLFGSLRSPFRYGTLHRSAHLSETEVLNQSMAVWRTGLVFDVTGNGRMALKANYSRYAQQVDINRVQDVNPLGPDSRTCPWSDPNRDGVFQLSEITVSQCSAYSGRVNTAYAPGVDWPYSDEVTAGIERHVGNDMRLGAMFYYRTNRDQLGSGTALRRRACTYRLPRPRLRVRAGRSR